jgi:hypothetical protein
MQGDNHQKRPRSTRIRALSTVAMDVAAGGVAE